MITIKTQEEIEILKEGGRRHHFILHEIAKKIKPGVSTEDLENFAREMIKEGGDVPAFLNYTPRGARRPYPSALCVSINEDIVHGIPNEEPKILKGGDIVAIDLGLIHQGMITDSAITLGVGEVSEEERKMLIHCEESLYLGIKAARAGARIGDISHAIESFLRPLGYGIPEGLAGHGVGYKVHEEPFVPNEGQKGKGEILKAGMVLALEPMVTLGTSRIKLASDGYTYKTADGSKSAHFEHTIVITDNEPIILTK